ncbi:MAG: hypothetical protein RID07_03270 [Lacipirellulaceae bacterium]
MTKKVSITDWVGASCAVVAVIVSSLSLWMASSAEHKAQSAREASMQLLQPRLAPVSGRLSRGVLDKGGDNERHRWSLGFINLGQTSIENLRVQTWAPASPDASSDQSLPWGERLNHINEQRTRSNLIYGDTRTFLFFGSEHDAGSIRDDFGRALRELGHVIVKTSFYDPLDKNEETVSWAINSDGYIFTMEQWEEMKSPEAP